METRPRNECSVCKRKFKNEKGVRIHQGKTACRTKLHSKVNESEDICTREQTHRSPDAQEVWRRTRRVPSMIFTRRTVRPEAEEIRKEDRPKSENGSPSSTKSKNEVSQGVATPSQVTKVVTGKKQQSLKEWFKVNEQSKQSGQPDQTVRPVAEVSSQEDRSSTEEAENGSSSSSKNVVSQEAATPGKNQLTLNQWVKVKENMQSRQPSQKVVKEGKAVKRRSLNSKESRFLQEWLRATAPIQAGNSQEIPEVKQQEEQSHCTGKLKAQPQVAEQQEEKGSKSPVGVMQTKELNLSCKDKVYLNKLISTGSREEILSKHNLRLNRRDMRSLLGSNWLSDNIIDEYLMKIWKRSQVSSDYPTVAVMTVHFYKVLEREGLEEGMKSTRNWIKEDLRGKEVVLVPIHKSHHWSLVYIDVKEKTIHYLDSLEGSRHSSSAPGMIKRFMEAYHKEKGEESKYKVRIRRDAPRQFNGVDCGVFVCQYSERLGRRSAFNFQQRDIPSIRWKMIWEILNGELKETVKVAVEDNTKKQKEAEDNSRARKRKEKPHKNEGKGKQKSEDTEKSSKEDKSSSRKQRIKWPKSNSSEWMKLNTDLTMILSSIRGAGESRAESHPSIIYSFCMERFGPEDTKEGRKETHKGPSRRQQNGKTLRGEINKLKETYAEAPEEEKEAISELQNEKLKKLRLLKRAESIKARTRKFKRNSQEFISQPFVYARKVLSPEAKGKLMSSKEEVEEYLKAAHSDPVREEELGIPEGLYEYPEVKHEFNLNPPTWKEFSNLLRKTRTKSAPGPNGVPYRLYKKCPGIARLLWSYLKALWKKQVVSNSWRRAEGVFIPKEEGASDISKFRTINLLNVEGKLQLGLLAAKLTEFSLSNGYIDTRIQKGGVPGISGCMEHTAILSQLIREAKKNKKDLMAVWLDIANAYGGLPHRLIDLTLERAHVPQEVQGLVHKYYDDVSIRFTTQQFTTEFLKIEKGIVTGCTLSVILFSLSMTMLVLSVRGETKGPATESGQQQEAVRLFMDDISTTTENKIQSKHLLQALADKLQWARLKVKPEKCRSLVIKKGLLTQDVVKIQGNHIPSVKEKPVKYLGKEYNFNLDDRKQVEATIEEVKKNLKKIGNITLPGRYKAWILQHMLLPKTMWPLTIYEFPATKVEKVQQLFTSSLKRWLGLPKSLSTDALYSTSGKLQLPYASVVEEVKAAKVRVLTTYQQSKDECIRNADINVDAGRKWRISKEVEEAKSRLHLQEIAGIANVGRAGIGMNHRQYYSTSNDKERRGLIVQQVRMKEEEMRRFNIVKLTKQAASTRWEVPERKLTHRDIISTSEVSLKFLIRSVYDLLPTPANKNVWFRTDEHKCMVCGGMGTLNHILSGCPVALQQGRYKWRHDLVLREIAKHIDEKRKQINSSPWKKRKKIAFVKAGEVKKPARQQQEADSYMNTARDWVLNVDLDTRLRVPPHITVTNLRPDMLLISERTKQMAIVELTVPSEERIEVSSELKKLKYAPIEEAGTRNKWKIRVWAVEVGCRGFPAASLSTFLKEVGVIGSRRKTILRNIGQEAERASQRIWGWSHMKQWGKNASS